VTGLTSDSNTTTTTTNGASKCKSPTNPSLSFLPFQHQHQHHQHQQQFQVIRTTANRLQEYSRSPVDNQVTGYSMGLPAPVLVAVAAVVVYYFSWYTSLALVIGVVGIRMWMQNNYQSMLAERLRLVRNKLATHPARNFNSSFERLADERQQYIVSLDATALAAEIREQSMWFGSSDAAICVLDTCRLLIAYDRWLNCVSLYNATSDHMP
jgi:hypothetical protein